MITEPDVKEALPKQGFLHDYVRYAARCTDCNAGYHLLSGLTLLSMTVPTEFHLPFAGGKTRGNFYGLIVGDSTRSRKTAAVEIARSVLTDAVPENVLEEPGSVDVLTDMLIENGQRTVFYSEFGSFLSQTVKSHMRPLREKLTQAYDALPMSRATVTRKKAGYKTTQPNPRLSILAAVTPGFLEAHTLDVDWTEGFLARFLTIYGERTRHFKLPPTKGVVEGHARLAEQLRDYRAMWLDINGVVGPCLGFSPGAARVWSSFQDEAEKVDDRVPGIIRAAMARAVGHARKVAPLLEWDFGTARSGEAWQISEEAMVHAAAIARLHMVSVQRLGQNLAPNEPMQVKRRVLQAIRGPTSFSDILHEAKIVTRRGHEMIDTLMVEGLIRRVPDPTGKSRPCFERKERHED